MAWVAKVGIEGIPFHRGYVVALSRCMVTSIGSVWGQQLERENHQCYDENKHET